MRHSALLLTLLALSAAAQAAPPSNKDGGVGLSGGAINVDFDTKEYDWWQHNCLDIRIGDSRLKTDCGNMDGKYRDHYNRSVHGDNNPGQGHNKSKGNNGKGKHN
ncbi:hypothetical protein [Aeromonas rivuli]|uniref:hypothetical protein n=1 Tax=Aeromonas rivuli TaxID=648794 RepID=UPI001CCC8489|nr:hypothetical protein [Aeromonas rivuli]UBO73509.1 hypothetical protein KYK33_17110 [Aeromonas rivuli]